MSDTHGVLTELSRCGLLLKQDKKVPNVVGILTGESLSTSWWSHPEARLIFAVISELANHRDVLLTKLLYRKHTFVHRSLWPALLTVATSQEEWQTRALSSAAGNLLERVNRGEEMVRATGSAVRELEVRLLAVVTEVHTQSGRHEMVLESWQSWAARAACAPVHPVSVGRKTLEQAAQTLGAPLDALPWRGARGRK